MSSTVQISSADANYWLNPDNYYYVDAVIDSNNDDISGENDGTSHHMSTV
jgi:hypothetical protein